MLEAPVMPPMPQQTSPHSAGNRAARVLWGVLCVMLFRTSPRPLHRWRNWLLRLFGARLHPTARVYSRARIWAPWNLRMGRYACIGDDVDVYCAAPVTIGDYATVSQYSYLCTATHDFRDVRHPLVASPITIQRRAWVAADVFIGPGVTIAKARWWGRAPPCSAISSRGSSPSELRQRRSANAASDLTISTRRFPRGISER